MNWPSPKPDRTIHEEEPRPSNFKAPTCADHITEKEKMAGYDYQHPPQRMFGAVQDEGCYSEHSDRDGIGGKKSEAPGSWFVS